MKGEYRYLVGNILLFVLFNNGRALGHPLIIRQTANIAKCELFERSVKSASKICYYVMSTTHSQYWRETIAAVPRKTSKFKPFIPARFICSCTIGLLSRTLGTTDWIGSAYSCFISSVFWEDNCLESSFLVQSYVGLGAIGVHAETSFREAPKRL